MPSPPAASGAETREIIELRRLKEEQPDLGSAVDLQIELLQLQKRIQARVPLPSIKLETEHLNSLARRRTDPAVRTPPDRMERRSIPPPGDGGSHAQSRRARGWATCGGSTRCVATRRSCRRSCARWYEATRPGAAVIDPDGAGLEVILQQAMRPVLIAVRRRRHGQNRPGGLGASHLSAVRRRARSGRHHPCGGALADLRTLRRALALSSDLVPVLPERRPDADHIARQPRRQVPDQRLRRVPAIHQGLRRPTLQRPVMPAVDSIATLPLDAAAIQRGYH